ncbi:MAG: sugar ABC transporter substrate-binding protein [Rhizobiales bacterium]|nr:sugar ABC transporter substrate-binding protein [Hyphomicrobiales bacterium]MBA70322.1 sugar ABC transporter substrate-binding protein [Hyphomicrobiales bacterium]
MRSIIFAASLAWAVGMSGAAYAKTLGIVALLANDALNIDVIGGATEAATAAGWDVKVIDTQASADQANAAMSTFAVQKVDAIFVLAFASSSIGSGLEAARQADIPVATWGGEIAPGIVATTSGRQVGDDSVEFLLKEVGENADILALTFHPGKLCIDRGIAFEEGVEGKSGVNVTYNEIVVPGQVQSGNAFAQAWLTSHPEGGDKKLGIWSCWDEPMSGAVAALRQAGRTDVVTVSINGSPQAIQLVKDGDMTATVWQPAYEEGKQVFQAILDAEEAGDSWEPKVISIPGVVVSSENVDEFMKDHPAK